MKTYLPAFVAELVRRDGAAPVWLLRFTAGGVDYVLCQDTVSVTPWGITALPLIASWGRIYEGISNTLADYRIGELSVNLINNPDAVTSLRTRAKARQLHGIAVSVYLWFDGCSAAPEELRRFRIRDIDLPTEALINLDLQDESIKYEKYYPGTIVTTEQYPGADPDDIGKTIPLIFGTVNKSETRSVDAGIKTTLAAGMSAAQTTMTVSDPERFWIGMWTGIDDETMLVTNLSGSTVTVTRGYDTTVAATHQKGADIIEIRPNDFAYIAADLPVQSIGKVWARFGAKLLDVTPISTIYTGQPGAEHASYPGQAVVTVPGFITISQAAQLMLNDGIGVSDLLEVLDGIGISDLIGVTDNIGINNLLSVLDGITVGDNIAVSDTIGISDALTVSDNIGVTDGISVSAPTISNAAHNHNYENTETQFPSNTPLILSSVGNYTLTFPAAPAGTISSDIEITIAWGSAQSIAGTNALTMKVNGNTYINDATGQAAPYNGSWTTAYNGKSITYRFGNSYPDALVDSVVINRNWGNGSDPLTMVSATRLVYSNDPTTDKTAANTVGGAAKSGTISKTGGATRGGSVSKTGSATKTGSASRGGLASLSGTLTKTGTVSKLGGVTRTGNVTRSGSVAKTGTVTLTGNSVANTLVGDAILVDVVAFDTAPADVIGAILGVPCQIIGTFPAGYAFNGQINTSRPALAWCHDLARQCRSYFRWVLDTPTLIVRPDTLTPVKSINEVRLSNGEMIHGQKLTDVNEVINTINLQYNRDWSGSNTAPYKSTLPDTDASSITTYGIRERPELFKFDFVTSDTMAADLLAFYLRWQAWQRWQHTQEVYLFEAALEFGDVVTLAFLEGEIGECTEVGFNPGSDTNIDKIQLTVLEAL